jgi:hypothetical protein
MPCANHLSRTWLIYLALAAIAAPQNEAPTRGTISGRITDTVTRDPVAGVRVTADTGDHLFSAHSTAGGTYALTDLPAASFTLTLQRAGYIDLNGLTWGDDVQMKLEPGQQLTRNFLLRPAARIHGTIFDRETRQPVPGMNVVPLREDHGMGVKRYVRATSATAQTNDKGEFELSNLEAGTYVLEFKPASAERISSPINDAAPRRVTYGRSYYPDVARLDVAIPIEIADGEVRPVIARLAKRVLLRVNGVIKVPKEWTAPVEMQLLQRAAGSASLITSGRLTTAGPFEIDNVSDGDYVLIATSRTAASTISAEHKLNIIGRDIEDLFLTLDHGLAVEGSVRMSEENVPLPEKLAVELMSTDFSAGGNPAAVASSGRFRLDGIVKGDYYFRVSGLPSGYVVTELLHGGHSRVNSAIPITGELLDSTVVFVVSNRPGNVSGTVTDTQNKPLTAAGVVLVPEPPPRMLDPFSLKRATSNPDGTFSIRDVPPGTYKAVVLLGSERASDHDITILTAKLPFSETLTVKHGQTPNATVHP